MPPFAVITDRGFSIAPLIAVPIQIVIFLLERERKSVQIPNVQLNTVQSNIITKKRTENSQLSDHSEGRHCHIRCTLAALCKHMARTVVFVVVACD